MYNVKCIMNNVHYTLYIISLGGFYKCALSDFEIVFEDKLKVVEGFCPPGNGGTEGGYKTIDKNPKDGKTLNP